jgi:tetratricopeptide (TPR) repeat protein
MHWKLPMKTRRILKITKLRLAVALGLCLVLTSAVLAQQEGWNELNQQAMKLHRQGKTAEAIPVGQRGLELAEKTFGPNHANVAKSLDNLARLYSSHRKYADAELLYKRSLAIREKALGPEHPDVARSLNDLAKVYRKTGRAEEASQLEERAQKIKSQSGSR